MANSKSNIYPIALQNAELNLNKYDAEIKQYSGFNKNNAPFVGGCLSNIFTKDETIEGNIYIDRKQNIYEVKTDGVYLNNNKIINYPNTTKFYTKRKLNVPGNAIMALSDNIYITLENDCFFEASSMEGESNAYYDVGYVAHWGDGFSKVLGPAKTTGIVHYDIVRKNNVVVFNYKRQWDMTGNSNTIFLYTLVVHDVNNEDYSYFSPKRGTGGYYYGCYSNGSGAPGVYILNEREIIVSANCFSGNQHANLCCIYLDEDVEYYRFTSYLGITYDFDRVEAPPIDTWCWHMTNDGYLYFASLMGYKRNGSYASYTFNSSLTGNQIFYYSAKVLRVDLDTQKIYVNLRNYFYIYNPANKAVSYYSNYKVKNYASPYYYFNTLVMSLTEDRTKGYVFSYCGNLQNGALVINEDTGIVTASLDGVNGVYFFGDFKILINNGYVSNISVADFYEDITGIPKNREGCSVNGVILEEWNSISNLLITDDGKKAVYKKADGFYIIERTETPSILIKYNQLVINCNNEYNAINLDTGDILHFGSDWNCSYLLDRPRGEVNRAMIRDSLFDFYSNSGLYASAVNEYELTKNASILINPVRLRFVAGGVYSFMCGLGGKYNGLLTMNIMLDGEIDFFCSYGDAATTAEYVGSSGKDYEHSSKLSGLPFPTDTNGNVLYNAPLFSTFIDSFGNDVFVKMDNASYQLHKSSADLIMSFYLGTLLENLEQLFILQGQYYGIIKNQIFSLQFYSGVVASQMAIVSTQGLQFCGNTPYEALFFSKTNRCLYSFTGANILNQKQLVDKISVVKSYKYNPATQSIFLLTDIGVIVSSLFGIYQIDMPEAENMFLLDNGVVLCDNEGHYRYIRYYKEDTDEDYVKQNINLETCFYGMNNQTITINDCLYMRLFSEEHESGDLEVSATTLSLQGRMTEKTTFKIKPSDWDKETHTIYLRYQPKEQRGLGISFKINSPFKIASMSVGSQADAILVDKVSKGAITAPQVTSSNIKW